MIMTSLTLEGMWGGRFVAGRMRTTTMLTSREMVSDDYFRAR
jgi:hypothetical protein